MKQLINNCLKINHLSKIGDFWQSLFKQNCLLCDGYLNTTEENSVAICSACLGDMPWQTNTACSQCGLASDGNICGSCLANPPAFDATHAVFLYHYPIDAMMVRYKYGNMLRLSNTFGQLLTQQLAPKGLMDHIDLVIPMPMHPKRIQERGFNQAHEIAKVMIKNSATTLDFKSATRIKLTPPQASLPLKARVNNIKGAFSVSANLAGKRIAIVDDVMTSGASLNELAKTLKKAGAEHVECWVIARTLPRK